MNVRSWFERRTVVTYRRPINRWAAMIVGILLLVCLCWAGFETGFSRAQQLAIGVESRIQILNTELKQLSDTLEVTKQALVASELQRTTLKERLKVLTPQLAQYRNMIQTLKDQQVYYKNLLNASEVGVEVVIESAEIIQGPNGERQFWALITQSAVQNQSTRGVLRLAYEYAEQSEDVLSRVEAVAEELPFEFVYFKRFEGNAPVPPYAVVRSATISVEIDGIIVANQPFSSLGF